MDEEQAREAAEARLRREAQFHDHSFSSDARASTGRFYTVAGGAFDRYEQLVMENVEGLKVLEYGCGPGSEAFRLAKAGAEVHGIDISQVAIDLADRKAADRGVAERCKFEVMDAESLTFPDDSFDRICGSGILHHLDLGRAFPQIARVLKPGGRAVFLEPLGHNPAINWYRRHTLEMRTEDEHPLLAKDFEQAEQHFARVAPEFFHLAVLASVPFQRHPYFEAVKGILDRVDGWLVGPRSPLRWAAWMVVLVVEAL